MVDGRSTTRSGRSDFSEADGQQINLDWGHGEFGVGL